MRRLLALAALARVVSKETPPNGAPWRHSEVNGQRTLEVYQDGWGVAHYAAWDNDVATLEAVDGATLAARDAHGQAAVHVAAMAGHVAALEMLAARGAAGELNGRGETAVAVAAQLGRATWLKRAGELGGRELLDAGSPPPAYLAARHGHGRAVDALGRGGADLGAVFRGWTPACAAAAEGHAAAVAALASHGGERVVATAFEGERQGSKRERNSQLQRLRSRPFPLVSADFWTSDHLSERPRSVDAFYGTRARETLTLKRR